MPEAKQKLMTVKDVAEYTQMSKEFVTRAASEGRIPALKLGVKWRFRRESVEEYVKSLESGPTGTVESPTHADSSELRKAS